MKYIWIIVVGIIWLGVLFDVFKSIKYSIKRLGCIDIEYCLWIVGDFTKAWIIFNVILLTICSFMLWI